MTTDFRCEKCGKLLSVDAQFGSTVRCPHCRKKVIVPKALAELPRPHVAPNAQPAAAPIGAGAEREEALAESEVPAVAAAMPWVISAFFHVGMVLVMFFLVMIAANPKAPEEVFIPGPVVTHERPGGVMNPKTDTPTRSQSERRVVTRRYTDHNDRVEQGKTKDTVQLLAAADGASGGAAELGLTNQDAGGGPQSRFIGGSGTGYHVVYVVDRSGSMAPTFDRVRFELLKSVAHLDVGQDFSIILFADNGYVQGPTKGLTPANEDTAQAAWTFLKGVSAEKSTTVLPALKRAFDVLKYADPEKPGKLIYLLSDGDFAGMSGGSKYTTRAGEVLVGNEAVIQWLRENNPKTESAGRVHVNTFLYLSNDREASNVMKTVATENGGQFKPVTADE